MTEPTAEARMALALAEAMTNWGIRLGRLLIEHDELVARLVRAEAAGHVSVAAKAVLDHWNEIGWFDGFDGTTNGTDYHMTQMTIEDEEEMSRRMDALDASLAQRPRTEDTR